MCDRTHAVQPHRQFLHECQPSDGKRPAGPPPAVKAILSKFGSGKEEDKLSGYLQLLKVGPGLLKFVPGEKAGDLKSVVASL